MAKRLKSYFEILAHWPASIINRKLTSIFHKADMKEEEAWNQYKERKGTVKGSSIMDRDVQSKSIMNYVINKRNKKQVKILIKDKRITTVYQSILTFCDKSCVSISFTAHRVFRANGA